MPSRIAALPTIDDVASAARVSTATVSRVLNKPDTVREALRLRVTEAVVRLGYVPHAGARALMLHRSGTVGAVFPTVDNAIFAKAIEALQRRLTDAGLQLLIATSGYDVDTEARQAMNLVTRGADALALCGVGQSPPLLKFLRQRALPTVHVMTYPAPAETVCVGFDNAKAIGQAVRYLLDLGHRRVAMLAGITRHNDRARARVAGVRKALKEAGLELPPSRIVERPYGLAEARDGFRALMAAAPAPTALLCGNDVLAFGALARGAEDEDRRSEGALGHRLRRPRDGAPHPSGVDDGARADRKDVGRRCRPADRGARQTARRDGDRGGGRACGARFDGAGAAGIGATAGQRAAEPVLHAREPSHR